MTDVVTLNIWQFSLVYILLIVVGIIMKLCKVNQLKLLIVGSVRMTVQLVLAGLILTYIFENPHPLFVIAYFVLMMIFAIWRILSQNKGLNPAFRRVVILSVALIGSFVTVFFIVLVVGQSIFNPQYVIPIAGMILGNTMTGISLGLRTFFSKLKDQEAKIYALTCSGAKASKILLPLVRESLEIALLPTFNSMMGLGIVSLPGMMTGQILSGTLPLTAILYQISISIAIAATVCLACFSCLYFGYKTLFNNKSQLITIKQ